MKKLLNKIVHFKTPEKIIELADVLCDFILYNSDNFSNVYRDIYNLKELKDINITSICAQPKNNVMNPRLLGLYYNKKTKLVMFDFINHDSIDYDIKLFINNVLLKNSTDIKDYYYNTSTNGKRIFFELSKIDNIISMISYDKFELYKSTTKYNL